jgi:hypothetical protein
MVRTQSLLVRNAIFGVASVVLAVVLALRATGTRISDDATGRGPAFTPVKVEKVVSLEIEQTTKVDGKDVKEGVKLVRTGPAAWKLASSFDYPADTGKVESYLKTLNGTKRHEEPTSNPAKFKDFAGPEGFLEVRVFESDGAPSLAFGIGKASAEGGYSAKKFVRVDDAAPAKGARILLVSGLDAYGSPTSATNWVETRMLPLLTNAEVMELAVDQGEAHRQVAFVRGKKPVTKDKDGKDVPGKDGANAEDPWNLTAPTAEPAVAETVMSLVRGFVGMTFASIEAGKMTPADEVRFGFDKPDLVIKGTGKVPADLGPTPTWTIRIGKKVEGKSAWYARRSTGEAVDPFVFTVNDYDLTEFRKDPSTWAVKKPEPPPAAPLPTAPAMDGATPPAMGEAPPSPPAMSDAPPTPAGMDAAPPAPAGMDATPPTAPPAPPPEAPKPPESPKPPDTPKDAPPPK